MSNSSINKNDENDENDENNPNIGNIEHVKKSTKVMNYDGIYDMEMICRRDIMVKQIKYIFKRLLASNNTFIKGFLNEIKKESLDVYEFLFNNRIFWYMRKFYCIYFSQIYNDCIFEIYLETVLFTDLQQTENRINNKFSAIYFMFDKNMYFFKHFGKYAKYMFDFVYDQLFDITPNDEIPVIPLTPMEEVD